MTDPHTPTRVMAQSAAQKAQDAYATARQAMSRMDTQDARIQVLEENEEVFQRLSEMSAMVELINKTNAEIRARVDRLEEKVAAIRGSQAATKRKAA